MNKLTTTLFILAIVGVVYSEPNNITDTSTPAAVTEPPAVSTEAPAVSTEAPAVSTEAPPASTEAAPITNTTTKAPQTTSLPSPTLAPSAQVGNWSVKGSNVTCILLSEALELHFRYENATSKGLNKTIYVPVQAVASGDCSGNHTNNITLSVYGGAFGITYTYYKEKGATAESNYYVKDIKVTYKMTDAHFPGIKTVTEDDESIHNATLYGASVGQMFSCDAEQTEDFDHDKENYLASITHSQLRSEGFRTTDNMAYSSTKVMCDDDLEVSNIVPIAVGAALAALVVIVLIAYLIGRKTRKRGYESV